MQRGEPSSDQLRCFWFCTRNRMKSVCIWHLFLIRLRCEWLQIIIIYSLHDAREFNAYRDGFYVCVSVSVPMLHLEERWKNFYHILHFRILQNKVEISQFAFKSDVFIGDFTWKPTRAEKYFEQQPKGEMKHIFSLSLTFLEVIKQNVSYGYIYEF